MKDTRKFEVLPQSYGYSSFIDDEEIGKELIKAIKDEIIPYHTNVFANRTGWHLEEKSDFKKITNILESILKQMVGEFYNHQQDRFGENTPNPKIDEMWGIVYKDGDFARKHCHYPCLWSGVFYIKTDKAGGNIVFPNIQKEITPKEGLVLIFPGSTHHYVERMIGDGERIVLAFNAGKVYLLKEVIE